MARKNEKKRRKFGGMAVVAMAVLGTVFLVLRKKSDEEDYHPVAAQVADENADKA